MQAESRAWRHHPVAFFPIGRDADGARTLEHRDLSGHGAGASAAADTSTVSPAQPREVQQAK